MHKIIFPVEYHQIDMRYRHTRIYSEAIIERLGRSIARHGQLRPVWVIEAVENRYILIDGYLRTEACKRRGLDTIMATVSQGNEKQALIDVLVGDQQRRLQAVEQACLLDELARRFEQSLSDLAHLTGRDKSWVQRRLMLVRGLPQSIMEAVLAGSVSSWVATRILAPLARANPHHAQLLTEYLAHHQVSTRQLNRFFDHYKTGTRAVRENIITQPDLFFKALANRDGERQARKLSQGPEGRFVDELVSVASILKRLLSRLPELTDPLLNDDYKKRISANVAEIRSYIIRLHERIANDRPTAQTNHSNPLPTRGGYTAHQPAVGHIAQYRTQSGRGSTSGQNRQDQSLP